MQASLIREAITELLTVNPELAARLAKAIEPKAVKSRKKLVYIADHGANCYCIKCVGTRSMIGAIQHGLMCAAGVVETGWSWRKAFQHQVESPKQIAERLTNCACGHPADAHHEDEMGSLLQCTAHIDAIDQDCSCDHFNYRIESEACAA